MITYQVEKIKQIKDELHSLLRLHYEEIALDRDHIPLDPDWERYEALCDRGNLFVATARNEEQQLIGYSIFFVLNHLHYKSTLVASNDVLYLHPDYRKGTTGIKLIKISESELKRMGVTKICWHIKFHKDFRNILYRMGYKDEDAIVGKVLKD
jgi:hypothetical protein